MFLVYRYQMTKPSKTVSIFFNDGLKSFTKCFFFFFVDGLMLSCLLFLLKQFSIITFRNPKYKQNGEEDVKSGSFINNNSISTPPDGDRNQSMHQLRLSFSALDQSNLLSRPREVTGSKSEELVPRKDDSLLSQNSWGPPPYGMG
jgi:hypothetical protein